MPDTSQLPLRCGFNEDALTETNAKSITHAVRDKLYGRAIA